MRPTDLLAHDCIGFRPAAPGAVYPWEFEGNGKELQIAPRGPVITNDSMLMIGAAKAGLPDDSIAREAATRHDS